jgi:hypothetical protein
MSGISLYTKEQLINLLIELGRKLNRTPKQKDLAKNGLPSANTYTSYFGSWGNALILSEFKPNHIIEIYSKEQLVDKLINFYNEYNKIPTTDSIYEIINKGVNFPSPYQFTKMFGSFEEAIKESKLHEIKIQDKLNKKKELFISELQRYYREFNKVPTTKDLNENKNYPRSEPIVRAFGSYDLALKEAKLFNKKEKKIQKPIYTKELIFGIFKEYISKNGIPQYSILGKNGLPSGTVVQKHFGNLNNLIEQLGYKPIHKSIRNDEELLNDVKMLYRKLNRVPKMIDFENDEDCLSYVTYSNHLGGYYNMLDLANIPYDKVGSMFSKEDIIDIWNKIINDKGRYPTRNDLQKYKIQSPISTIWGNYYNFLEDIGTPINNETYGFRIYFTKNNTSCFSEAELNITEWFEENNIDFNKEVYYKNIIPNDKSNRRFDWVIDLKGEKYYIEYFGIVNNDFYDKKTKDKIEICKKYNLNLISIFPDDLKNKTLNQIFSFLFK